MADYSKDSSTADMPPSDPVFSPAAHPMDVGRLGKYRVLKQLGKGGMGAVYLGYDPQLQRKVALKVMLPKYAANSDARQRFLREARAAAKIKSDHVVTIHDIGEDAGNPFFALEYLQGKSLDEFLKEKGAPNVAQAMRIGREVAAGLAAANALGLIHRDIKPGNLWLEAPKGRIKILDFGLAKLLTPGTAAAELTQVGQAIGTPAYMSPEQARGTKVDHRTDLFSLGGVLYRLLTGRLPFPGANQVEVLLKVTMEEPKPIRELNPKVPERVAELVHRLLAKDPALRPAKAEEVIAALAKNDGSKEGASGPGSVQTVYVPIAIAPQQESVFAGIDESSTEIVAPEGGDTPVVKAKKAAPEPKPLSRWWTIGSAVAVIALVAAAAMTWRVMRPPPKPPEEPPPAIPPYKPPELKPFEPKPDSPKVPPKVEVKNAPQSNPTPFFNGKDVSGWKPEGLLWRYEGGALILSQPDPTKRSALKSDFNASDFELTFKAKTTFHTPDPMNAKPNIECYLLFRENGSAQEYGALHIGIFGGTLHHGRKGSLGWVGVSKSVSAEAKAAYKLDDFNTFQIGVVGKQTTVKVNGAAVCTDHALDYLPSEGRFTWSLPAGCSELRIRDVKFTDLSERGAAEKLVAVADLTVVIPATGAERSVPRYGALPAEPFVVVSIQNPRPADREEFFAALGELRSLRVLADYVKGIPATAENLNRIAAMPCAATIEKLHLPSFSLTMDTIPAIKKFPKLRALHLYAGAANDAALAALVAAVPPQLAALNLHVLHTSHVTDVGLRKLLALPLSSADFSVPKGMGARFGSIIAEFPKLTNLSFGAATPEDLDAGLRAIAGCPKLESLTLHGVSPLRDSHIAHLKPLASLRTLNVKSTSDLNSEVTEAGAKELAKDLPKCHIVGDTFTVEPTK